MAQSALKIDRATRRRNIQARELKEEISARSSVCAFLFIYLTSGVAGSSVANKAERRHIDQLRRALFSRCTGEHGMGCTWEHGRAYIPWDEHRRIAMRRRPFGWGGLLPWRAKLRRRN